MFRKFIARATFVLAALALSLSVSAALHAAQPLVDPAWLKAHLGEKNLVVLDVTSRRFYERQHIPGAVFSSFRDWREKRGEVKGLLPPVEKVEKLIGSLGIGNEDHVVIVPGGYSSGDIGIATRVYWTFKTMGHDNVSILDGGMKLWLKDRSSPREQKINKPRPKTFRAKFTDRWLATSEDVLRALKEKTAILVDNRPVAQHVGIRKSGSVAKYGAIPNEINLPEPWVLSKGRFRPVKQLVKLHELLGIKAGAPVIHTCNTGHKATLGWFARSQLMGEKNSKLYDASLAEWSRLPAETHPMVVKLDIRN